MKKGTTEYSKQTPIPQNRKDEYSSVVNSYFHFYANPIDEYVSLEHLKNDYQYLQKLLYTKEPLTKQPLFSEVLLKAGILFSVDSQIELQLDTDIESVRSFHLFIITSAALGAWRNQDYNEAMRNKLANIHALIKYTAFLQKEIPNKKTNPTSPYTDDPILSQEEINLLIPANNSFTRSLPQQAIAMIHAYWRIAGEDQDIIENSNKDKIAQAYGYDSPNSGHSIYNHFTKFLDKASRCGIKANKRSDSTKFDVFETTISYLKDNGQKAALALAEADFKDFKKSYETFHD